MPAGARSTCAAEANILFVLASCKSGQPNADYDHRDAGGDIPTAATVDVRRQTTPGGGGGKLAFLFSYFRLPFLPPPPLPYILPSTYIV